MRWFRNKFGDLRYIKKFAISPIEIKGEIKWLEWVYVMQKYVGFRYKSCWENVIFITKEEYNEMV